MSILNREYEFSIKEFAIKDTGRLVPGDLKRNADVLKVRLGARSLLCEAKQGAEEHKASAWLTYTGLIHHMIVPFSTRCLTATAFIS